MSAITECNNIEKKAFADVMQLANDSGIYLHPIERQPFYNKMLGDFICKLKQKGDVTEIAELKAEASNLYGNLFLEVWSNLSRFTPGWLITSEADRLWYYFIEQKELYECEMLELKEWAFCKDMVFRFNKKKQEKREQLNDTWGYCVPISTLNKQLKTFRRVNCFVSNEINF